MQKNIQTYKLLIKGKVQDVGYRYWFRNSAILLCLNGFIQNLENKNEVLAIIQGDINNILNLTKKCKRGPKIALVNEVISSKTSNNIIYSNFIIKYNN